MSITHDATRASRPVLGANQPNIEWDDKTTGRARYADDHKPEGLLYAAILRSPHPHAQIVSLDTRRVRKAPGVVAVITAQDLRTESNYIHHGYHLADRTVLARDKVRYIGEEVAAVAAETPDQARAALKLFDVKYKPLKEATSLAEAQAPNAPLIHENNPGNVALAFTQDFGPRESVPGAVSVSGRFVFPRQNHACMETNSIVAHWREDEQVLHVWVSTQAPYFVEKELAHVLGLERSQIVVHEVAVGGGFGSKSKISEYEAIAATLSMQTGRPVRLALTRDEEFATVKSRHRFEIDMTTTVGPDGLLLSRDADVVVENGAYNHSGPSVMGAGTGAMISLYRVPAVHVDARLIYTNRLPGGQFRGYGNPQATFAVETQMDQLAEKLGIDPFEFRIRNANRAGERTHAGYQLDSAALVECLEAARDAIGWAEKKSWARSGRGVGVACAIQVSGAYVYPEANKSSAALDLYRDGSVVLRFGGADAGTGQRTLLAQVVADELGVPIERVDVSMMDSRTTPQDLGAWSSRGTYMSAHATIGVCGRAVAELRDRVAELAGVSPDQVEFRDGLFRAAGRTFDVAEVLAATVSDLGPVSVEHEFTAHVEEMDWESGTGNISGAYSFAAHAVEVEVDKHTGKVRVVDYVAAHDSGEVLNPLLADSQVIGGVVMGLGAALGEELIFEGGRMVNPSYLNYPLPRAADVPRIRPLFVAATDPNGPRGAKGIGEIVLVPTVGAVGNAIAHATGARIYESPFTPDKVLQAWTEARGEKRSRSYHLWRRPDRWQIAAMRKAYPLGVHTLLHRYGTRFAKPVEPTPASEVVMPERMETALEQLAQPQARPIGGGTDLIPGQRKGNQALGKLVDLTLLPGLGRIDEGPDGVRIGGTVRLATLAEGTGTDWRGVLGETARRIASPQVREMATIAGNLCQEKRCWFYRNDFMCYKRGGVSCPCYAVEGDSRFFHAVTGAHRCQAVTPSDLATTLVALDADVTVERHGRPQRTIPVADLYSGPGETKLADGEVISSINLPTAALRREYAFTKLDLWSGDFAVVAAAAGVERSAQGRITDARLVLGAVAPTPLRLTEVERQLVERTPNSASGLEELCHSWGSRAHPLRRNEWKIDAAAGVLVKALAPLLGIKLD